MLEVELVVHTMDGCTTVDFTDDGEIIVSSPDSAGMVGSVPAEVAQETDFWWVVAPSGGPGDGSGDDRHFIIEGQMLVESDGTTIEALWFGGERYVRLP